MKRALEAVLVAAALASGAFVFHQWRARRDLAAKAAVVNPGAFPGSDREGLPVAVLGGPHAGSVTSLPMLKLSSPPKPPRRGGAVPPPAPAP